jgi:Peptidase propeptide and YPEB domain
MHRPSLSRRHVVGVALTLSVGTGIGLAAYTFGAAADPYPSPRTGSAIDTLSSLPGDVPTPSAPTAGEEPTSTPLTLDEATAVAARAASAPGRVIEWDEDNEPTGLRYDVTLLHDDGTTTDVEVDTVTGQVTSVDHDTDRD